MIEQKTLRWIDWRVVDSWKASFSSFWAQTCRVSKNWPGDEGEESSSNRGNSVCQGPKEKILTCDQSWKHINVDGSSLVREGEQWGTWGWSGGQGRVIQDFIGHLKDLGPLRALASQRALSGGEHGKDLPFKITLAASWVLNIGNSLELSSLSFCTLWPAQWWIIFVL